MGAGMLIIMAAVTTCQHDLLLYWYYGTASIERPSIPSFLASCRLEEMLYMMLKVQLLLTVLT
jgi:hypothetical protein